MSKKSIRLISIIFTVALVLTMLTSSAFAINSPADLDSVQGSLNTDAENKIAGAGKTIIDIISTVGMIVAVVVLMILGIKYMVGSAEEKASYKKTMMPYLVGALLIFGASAIANVVFNMAQDFLG